MGGGENSYNYYNLNKKLPGAPMGGAHGGPQGGGNDFFEKLKGCGGEGLRRLFRLDFCIFEFFIKSIFEKMAKTTQNEY